MPLIEVDQVTKRFGATLALDRASFKLDHGEVHAVIGENGAGKSTLMNVLAGSLKPDSGSITLEGKAYRPANPQEARGQGIALIHQEISLCPHLTVAENVSLGREPARAGWIDRQKLRRRTLDVLESFHHPEIHPGRPVRELSIAARQVVEICRALAAKARIILMDEPTSSLQRSDVEHLFSLISTLRSQGVSVIYISHQLEEVREIADRYTVLRDGTTAGSGCVKSVTDRDLISLMVGRPIENLYPPRKRKPSGEIILGARDLVALPEVRHASFQLRRGEVLGLAGLIGSGRTNLVRALFGLQPVTSGSLWLRSRQVAALAAQPSKRIAEGFGYLSEDRQGEGLARSLSVADNVTCTRYSACSKRGWLDIGKQQNLAQEWISNLSVKARSPSQQTRMLSGGNQQKVALARLLHQESDILLLDEPTRGIDIGSKALVYEVIARCAEQEKAVLLVSSYLPELFGMCDRLAVMCRGRLTPARPAGEWTPESVMCAAIGQDEGSGEPHKEAGR